MQGNTVVLQNYFWFLLAHFQSDWLAEWPLPDPVDGRDSEVVGLFTREIVHNQGCGGSIPSELCPAFLHQQNMKRGGKRGERRGEGKRRG